MSLIEKLEVSPDASNWLFKSYKQLVKINFNAQNYNEALDYLRRLTLVFSQVDGTYAEESLVRMINNYSTSTNQEFVSMFYDIVLKDIVPTAKFPNKDRIWPKIHINKLNAFLDAEDYAGCTPLIQAIGETLDSSSDSTKKLYSLDFIAAKMAYQLQVNCKDIPKLNTLYRKTTKISSAVTHPRTLGRIQECGAVIQFFRGNYSKARLFFYECFNNYDDVGSTLKRKILKYLVLCSMLTGNELNPFASQETRVYSELVEFQNLLLLIRAFDSVNVRDFTRVLEKMELEDDVMLQDPIFNRASVITLGDLRRKLVSQYLFAFKRVPFLYLLSALGLSEAAELELIFHGLAVSGNLINVKIDFVDQIIYSGQCSSMFDINLTPKDFYRNVLVGGSIGIDVDGMGNTRTTGGAPEPCHSGIRQLVFASEKTLTGDWWANPVSDLMQSLYSALPSPNKGKISQMDQIALDQEAEKAGSGDFSYSSSIPQHDAEESETGNDHSMAVNKSDLLRAWAAALEERTRS